LHGNPWLAVGATVHRSPGPCVVRTVSVQSGTVRGTHGVRAVRDRPRPRHPL